MDLIPTWVQRLWDTWDLRVLVLFSFTLQIILSLFGSRRKYISSVWISVLVWSTYLMADWVATVALGKLTDVQGDRKKSNVLWAIWAPLLLLHLGGPDRITAYSLQDNQLWLRHLLGLVVQLFVAINVILLSWKNSWFSFMSLPALIAGIIKYGERTWVLNWVSGDKYLVSIPLGSLKQTPTKYYTEGNDYVRVLVLAHELLDDFMKYLESEGNLPVVEYDESWAVGDNIMFDAVEVKMGLMYDLLYTKVPVIYSKGGFIMRCISFGSTVSVLVGLIFRIVFLETREGDEDHHQNWIDIAITGVLIVGALALEIYAAIVLFSSNWGMLWLIKHGKKEWVIGLSQRFPRFFNKKKNWSQMMGQFDLLGYLHKSRERDVQSPSSKIIGKVFGGKYEEKWNRYQHKTECSVHPLVYNAILELLHEPLRISGSLTRELDEIWAIPNESDTDFLWLVRHLYLATQVCYNLETEWDAAGGEDDPSGSNSSSWEENMKVSKALSDYMMYLLIMRPSLLPNVGSRLRYLETLLFDRHYLTRDESDVNATCRYLLRKKAEGWGRIAKLLKGKERSRRWELIKLIWLRTLHTATRGRTSFGLKNSHFQQLREGGELLTLIWFINPPRVYH